MAITVPGKRYDVTTTPTSQPTTPGGTATTTTVTRPGTPDGAYDPNAPIAGLTEDDIAAQVAELRIRIASGEDVSLGAFGSVSITDTVVRDDTRYGGPGTFDRQVTVRSLLDELTRWDSSEIQQLQRELYAAGYFPPQYYDDPTGHPILWGNKTDTATRRAFQLLLADGILYKGTSIDKILADRAQDFAQTGMLASGARVRRAGVVGGGNLYTTELTDPATIRELSDEIAQGVLGRNIPEDKKAQYVDLLQRLERESQGKVHGAQEANAARNFAADTAMADRNVAGQNGGSILAPVAGGKYGQTIGAQREGHLHEGVDIMAPIGTAVTAAASGKVRFVRSGGSGGLRVEVVGDDGRVYRYMHLSAANVKDGQRLAAGEQLGKVGDSGNATGTTPHLHFEVRLNDTPLDPIPLIGAEAGAAPGTGLPAGQTTYSGGDQYLDPQFVETTRVDAQARLTEQIRADNPAEAGAHDIAGQFERFKRIMGGGPQ